MSTHHFSPIYLMLYLHTLKFPYINNNPTIVLYNYLFYSHTQYFSYIPNNPTSSSVVCSRIWMVGINWSYRVLLIYPPCWYILFTYSDISCSVVFNWSACLESKWSNMWPFRPSHHPLNKVCLTTVLCVFQ